MKKIIIAAGAACLGSSLAMAVEEIPLYLDVSKSVSERTEDLLSRMTLEEKIAQIGSVWQNKHDIETDDFLFTAKGAKEHLKHGIGQIARPSENKEGLTINKTPQQTLDFVNQSQRWLVENTRLRIPAIYHVEALHGLTSRYGTSFPQAIALASSWDPQLIHDIYSVAAKEAYLQGAHQALTPILDVARDPRWGRFEETMGEDPYLVATLGLQSIVGFQGDRHGVIPENKVIATLKHLAGHGEPRGGLNIAPAPIGERALREVFLFPFEVAVKLGGARSVMASYNEIDGIPSHANKKLLTDILRGEWGFEGVLVSDYFAIDELISRHGLVETKAQAAKRAIEAGVDIELPDTDAYFELAALVKKGELSEEIIDRAVSRILHEKFILGLFEQPYRHIQNVDAQTGTDESRVLARVAAERSMILLRNEGDVLPLDLKSLDSIAVIGPHVHETLLGGYSDVPRQTISILEGMQKYVGDRAQINYAKGAIITVDPEGDTDSVAANTLSKERWTRGPVVLPTPEQEAGLIEEAVNVAKKSDVVLLVVGENEGIAREGWAESHLGDRVDLGLYGSQKALVDAVIATGKPVVLMLQNGRPLAITEYVERIPAIIEGWYLGQETGDAVARVLFGDVNPSGKLPVSIPRSVGHIPVFYNHKKSAKRGYHFEETTPLYAFGHGLSYTKFDISRLKINKKKVSVHDEVEISVRVKNTGKRAGEEVVQLYLNDPFASVTRPVKELKGFTRVKLEPGKSRTVTFTVNANQMGFYDVDMNFIVEPGQINVMVGNASDSISETGSFEISGKTTKLKEFEKQYLSKVELGK